MPRVSDIEILEKREQPTLYIRATVPVQQLPQQIGQSYAALGAYLQQQGAFLADMPYVAYHNMDMAALDVEIGFPVARQLPGSDDICSGLIPAQKVVFCLYRGAYSEIEPVYNDMAQWIGSQALAPTGLVYEHYLNGPPFPEEEMLTMVVMPLV